MLDELEPLEDGEPLGRLLEHYAVSGLKDSEAWQDRIMHMPGVDSRDLVTLHGLLLAHGWIEQNTGVTTILKPGVAACSYRITGAGMRAFRLAGGRETLSMPRRCGEKECA
jgi:hypothetical protein